MECSEFQKNIQPFIYGQLNMLKEEEMLEHLLTCKECNDELEIYYTIINCVKELEGKLETSDNYHGEYNDFIEKTKRDIKKYKNRMLRRRVAFPGVVGATILFTGLSVKTETDIPKDKIFDCMVDIFKAEAVAPVKIGDIIIENCAGTGIAVVATRNVGKNRNL